MKLPEVRQGDKIEVFAWTSSDLSGTYNRKSDIQVTFDGGSSNIIFHHDVSSFSRFLDRNSDLILIGFLSLLIFLPFYSLWGARTQTGEIASKAQWGLSKS